MLHCLCSDYAFMQRWTFMQYGPYMVHGTLLVLFSPYSCNYYAGTYFAIEYTLLSPRSKQADYMGTTLGYLVNVSGEKNK